MARPLPNMKAPAFKKNKASDSRTPVEAATAIHGLARIRAILDAMPAADARAAAGITAQARSRRSHRGGASRAIISRPATMNRTAISAPVAAVTMARTTLMAHSRRSRRLVSLASFQAAMAMMAITAGAMP